MLHAIGIDIGGTSIKGIAMDNNGGCHEEVKFNTDASEGKDHIIANVEIMIRQLLEQYPETASIGIGTAGRVNKDTGQIIYATDNLPGWNGFRLKEHIEAVFKKPVIVDNDGNAALIGEHWLGACMNLAHVTMLTLGTGVGGANMMNGRMVRGAHWNGGEWGHVVLVPNGYPCNCGLYGCVEQYLSGTALARLARESTNRSYADASAVIEDYIQGDETIISVFNQYLEHLGILIHNIHIGINPQAIVIGGGLIGAKDVWWGLLKQKLDAAGQAIDVRPALLGNRAGAIGAAKLALDQL